MWGSLLSRPLLMQGIGLVGARVSVHVEIQLGDILTLVLQLPLLLALALLSSFPNGAPIHLYDVQRFKIGNGIVASKEEDFTVLNRINVFSNWIGFGKLILPENSDLVAWGWWICLLWKVNTSFVLSGFLIGLSLSWAKCVESSLTTYCRPLVRKGLDLLVGGFGYSLICWSNV